MYEELWLRAGLYKRLFHIASISMFPFMVSFGYALIDLDTRTLLLSLPAIVVIACLAIISTNLFIITVDKMVLAQGDNSEEHF